MYDWNPTYIHIDDREISPARLIRKGWWLVQHTRADKPNGEENSPVRSGVHAFSSGSRLSPLPCFLPRAQVLSPEDMQRALLRIAHQILERNRGLRDVVVVGMSSGGVWLADAIAHALNSINANDAALATDATGVTNEMQSVPTGQLDFTRFRDDVVVDDDAIAHYATVLRGTQVDDACAIQDATRIPFSIEDKVVVLVDDVIFTGRSVRAALNALCALGRPRCMQLAVLVDRGHREVPIRPDFVGKNIPTRVDEHIEVDAHNGVWIGEMIAQ